MLIAAARRAEAAAKEMLALVNEGSASCAQMREMLAVSKATVAMMSIAQASAAASIAGRERHGDGGTQVLADTAGLSRRDAHTQVKTAKAIDAVPAVRDAVEEGRVSLANAKRLAEAVEKTSAEVVESDAVLLSKAESMRPEQFTQEVRRWAADHQDDGGEADYRRLRAKRYVRIWDSDDGTVELHGKFDPVAGRRIGNRLQAEARRLYAADKKHARASDAADKKHACASDAADKKHARASDAADKKHACASDAADKKYARASDAALGRSFQQCMADALDNLTSSTSAGNGKPFADICVVAHVDDATGDLIAELPDGVRLPQSVLEQLACNSRVCGVVYDRKGKPIWRTEARRTVTEPQWQMLIARYGGCFHCGANPAMCQAHHIEPVSQGGPTKLDNLVPACWGCHHRIHYDGWQIRRSPDGQHTLHPPDHVHYGPALSPDQPLLFRSSDHATLHPSPAPRPSEQHTHGAAQEASAHVRPGPASARAALRSAKNDRDGPGHGSTNGTGPAHRQPEPDGSPKLRDEPLFDP